ncbi:hypothetical protein D3C80_1757310 [compost metagenome]
MRYTEVLPCQKPINGSKGKDVFRKMRNLPIGFSVTQRRIIGHLRRIHQNLDAVGSRADRLVFAW